MPEGEPIVVMAHSPRSWARSLKQHLIDHGGGRIMASIMSADEALVDGFDVFLADDTTSFLDQRFVADLQRRSIAVVGVYDPDEAEGSGKERLIGLQVDDVIVADAPPAQFLRILARASAASAAEHGDRFSALMAQLARPTPESRDPFEGQPDRSQRGRLIVIAGASGGVGTTEMAIGLAVLLAEQGSRVVLVDADDVGPSVAQRLALQVHPNLRSAIDLIHNSFGDITNALLVLPIEGLEVMGGLAHRRDWFELRPADVCETVLELARIRDHVVINVSSRLEDLPAIGGPARYGVTRSMLALADTVVLVAGPTPIGVARVLDWIAEAQPLIEATPIFVAFNSFNGGAFEAAEINAELQQVYQPRSIVFIPYDKNLGRATWQGTIPGRGPFMKGLEDLASAVAPPGRPSRRHSRKRRPWNP